MTFVERLADVATSQAGDIGCTHALSDWSVTWHAYGVHVAADATRCYVDDRLRATRPAAKNAEDPFPFMVDLPFEEDRRSTSMA